MARSRSLTPRRDRSDQDGRNYRFLAHQMYQILYKVEKRYKKEAVDEWHGSTHAPMKAKLDRLVAAIRKPAELRPMKSAFRRWAANLRSRRARMRLALQPLVDYVHNHLRSVLMDMAHNGRRMHMAQLQASVELKKK